MAAARNEDLRCALWQKGQLEKQKDVLYAAMRRSMREWLEQCEQLELALDSVRNIIARQGSRRLALVPRPVDV
jgi:hypothetical protein